MKQVSLHIVMVTLALSMGGVPAAPACRQCRLPTLDTAEDAVPIAG